MGVPDLCTPSKASMGLHTLFLKKEGGVREPNRLQKRTKLVLGRWPHSAEARQDATGVAGHSSSPEEEPGGTGTKKALGGKIETPAARKRRGN